MKVMASISGLSPSARLMIVAVMKMASPWV
jgi:hypothetical protein